MTMLSEFLLYAGAAFGALMPIVNPVSATPVFLSVTAGDSTLHRARQAKMAAWYAASILLVALFAGALVMEFFGITLPVLRIAGGLVVTRVGFGMLDPGSSSRVSDEERTQAVSSEDVAFMPVAMPMLSGPGSIAVTIALATEAGGIVSYMGIAAGIVVISLIAWATLHYSGAIVRVIGDTGMNALTRIMGLILICIGITFVTGGIVEGLTTGPMVSVLRDWIQALRSN